ncbi:MAG: deoxyribose-phosphate aldolase [Tannerellaceae bacterium]
MSKYHEAFQKHPSVETAEQIKANVDKILSEKFTENFNKEVLKKIFGFIDLTSLTSIDTKDSIYKLVQRVNDLEGDRPDLPCVAAICTYPNFAETVKQALTANDVKIACVTGGFPSSQTFPEIKVAETALAITDGADEIDIVLNLGLFFEENYEELNEEIEEIKYTCREAKLKVILETGALTTPDNIRKASVIALYSGADFIKTSTGKGYPGASFEAVYTMCKVLKEYSELNKIKKGIKVSGGVSTAEDAVKYYTIVKEVLGEEWLHSDLFRIGASSLVNNILEKIGE